MDRLTSMAVFVKAADLGSFTSTSAALGISAQMVGKHIAFLEDRLGAQLIHRSTRRQSLTTVGRAFYERCRTILAETEAAEALVDDLSLSPRGTLRINAPIAFGSIGLAPVIADYLHVHQQVDIELELTDRFVDIIHEGWDAVVRLGELNDSGLAARPLATYRLVVCASPDYLVKHGVPKTPNELITHECLGFSYWSGFQLSEWTFMHDGYNHRVQIRSRFRVNDGRMLRAFALNGTGVILQPEILVRDDLAAGRLIELLPDYAAPSRPIHILFSSERPQTPKLRAFIDAVVNAFGNNHR